MLQYLSARENALIVGLVATDPERLVSYVKNEMGVSSSAIGVSELPFRVCLCKCLSSRHSTRRTDRADSNS